MVLFHSKFKFCYYRVALDLELKLLQGCLKRASRRRQATDVDVHRFSRRRQVTLTSRRREDFATSRHVDTEFAASTHVDVCRHATQRTLHILAFPYASIRASYPDTRTFLCSIYHFTVLNLILLLVSVGSFQRLPAGRC